MDQGLAFAPGARIPDTAYRVVKALGQGGMGSVYLVEHLELGKHFVLKALLSELTRRPDLVARLRNEQRALGRLEHPNIVTVTDAGMTGDTPYYVMERLEGETLGDRLKRQRRLSIEEACGIAHGILSALDAAHAIGVVHRDVKPPNVFLVNGRHVKLLDFGIAKVAQATDEVITARGIAIGTPRYMAPEQARGETVDGRADIYAVGLLLYEMLVGRGPFDDVGNANELLLAHLTRRPPALESLVQVPRALGELVDAMLAKQQAERPATAAEAARWLAAVLQRPSMPPPSLERPSVTGQRVDAPTQAATPQAASWSERTQADPVRTLLLPDDGGRTLPVEARTSVRGEALGSTQPLEAPVASVPQRTARLYPGPGSTAPQAAVAPRSGTLKLGEVEVLPPTIELPVEEAPPTRTRVPVPEQEPATPLATTTSTMPNELAPRPTRGGVLVFVGLGAAALGCVLAVGVAALWVGYGREQWASVQAARGATSSSSVGAPAMSAGASASGAPSAAPSFPAADSGPSASSTAAAAAAATAAPEPSSSAPVASTAAPPAAQVPVTRLTKPEPKTAAPKQAPGKSTAAKSAAPTLLPGLPGSGLE